MLLALLPVAFLRERSGTAALLPSFSLWTLGMAPCWEG